MEVGFPFKLDGRGHVADPDYAEHVRQMIEQLLFTSPGQRVNRPDFGAGLLELIFAAESDELLSATELLVQSSLQRWLGDVIDTQRVLVTRRQAQLTVTIHYVIRGEQQRRVALFEPTDLPWRR